MPKYNVTLYCTASADYQVEAESEAEAIDKAVQLSNEQADQEFLYGLHVGAFQTDDSIVEEVKEAEK